MDYINNIDILRGKVEYFIYQTSKSMRLKREANINANVLTQARLINSLSIAIDELIAGTAPDQTISYIISLIPDLDQLPVTPFNPLVLQTVAGSVIGSGGSSMFAEGFEVTTIKAGSWLKGDFVESNADVRDVVKKMLQEVYPPTLSDPSWSLSISPQLAEVDSETDVTLNWTYSPGTKGGAVDELEYEGQLSSLLTHTWPDFVIQLGLNEFISKLTTLEGPQLYYSDGEPFGTPFPPQAPELTRSVEGVFPIYADNVKQPLYSMINGNNIELDLLPEGGGAKQDFEIANSWRPLVKIEFFNTVSGLWDSTNKLPNFSVGAGRTGYTKYTSTDPDRGAIKIKLVF